MHGAFDFKPDRSVIRNILLVPPLRLQEASFNKPIFLAHKGSASRMHKPHESDLGYNV